MNGACNATWFDHTITVRSADTEEIKCKVLMCGQNEPRQVYCSLASSWGRGAEFDFSHLDQDKFSKMKQFNNKLTTALYRLKYAWNLSDSGREMYLSWFRKNGAKIITALIESADLDGIRAAADYGALNKSNIKKMIAAANDKGCVEITAFLMDYQHTRLDPI